MGKLKEITQRLLSSLEPQPNPFMEQAKELAGDLDPAVKAQVLAQLAVAEEINRLENAVSALGSRISGISLER